MPDDLGMSKRRKKAKKAGVDVKDLDRDRSEPTVSRSDFASLQGNLAVVQGELQEIRESIPTVDVNEQAALNAKIDGEILRIDLLEEAIGNAISKTTILEQQLESLDIGEYNVEEFPI